MTLHELREKINSRDVFFSTVIILVGFASFGLGRLSLLESKREPVQVENALMAGIGGVKWEEEKIAVGGLVSPKQSVGGQIVASKTSTKYHYPWCAGAAQISEKNKVWFASVEAARNAGYTPANNCKGLK